MTTSTSMRRPADLGRTLVAVLTVLVLLASCGHGSTQATATTTPVAAKVAFWGDSLTEGFPSPPFAGDHTNSLPGTFATHNPASVVYNGGVSGQAAEEVAVRQGGMTLHLQVVGGVIPASGAVKVITDDILGWRLDRLWWCEGSLGGVVGTVVRSGNRFEFRRDEPGEVVRVQGSVPFVSRDGVSMRDHVQVLFVGRNDIGYASASGDPVTRVMNAYQAMVDYLPAGQRALVLGTTTGTWETRGTGGYNTIISINTALAARYPLSYWDARSWLVHDAIYAIGATPTEQDRINMAADTLPPSIMVPNDTVHYSPATAAALADEIREQLRQRGWISAS